jgi:hypothetical protein
MSVGRRPPGSGRKRGTPNKATAEVRTLAQRHGPDVIEELARIALRGLDDRARVAACRELLDRGYGRPGQAVEVSGVGGAPLLDWHALINAVGPVGAKVHS